jgi:hypothetical protein
MPVAHPELTSVPLFRERLVLVSSAARSYRVREGLAGVGKSRSFLLPAPCLQPCTISASSCAGEQDSPRGLCKKRARRLRF